MTLEYRSFTAETAPEGARAFVAGSEKKLGFLASPVARTAGSPPLLATLLSGFAAFDRSSLSAIEREVVALTVAFENECHYCMALHSSLLSRNPEHAAFVAAMREGRPLDDERLEALRGFTLAVLRDRGRVDPEVSARFAAAGFESQHALDVVLGVGVYVLSTLANIVTQAPLDPPLAPFAWSPPTKSAA